jgi:hypothetical protein
VTSKEAVRYRQCLFITEITCKGVIGITDSHFYSYREFPCPAK